MSIYLNAWKDGNFIDVVADFEGIYMNSREYEAKESPYPNVEAWLGYKAALSRALAGDVWQGVEIILAAYGDDNYSGDAFVLFRKDGKLYEVNGSHCSCNGLEGQWEPEETTAEALRHRLDRGALGIDGFSGNFFADELRSVLNDLEHA